MDFNFIITQQETEIIIDGLINMPYKISATLIQKLSNQIQEQIQALENLNNNKENENKINENNKGSGGGAGCGVTAKA